jgi:hypothetical protein
LEKDWETAMTERQTLGEEYDASSLCARAPSD